jgi:hypothetical protein
VRNRARKLRAADGRLLVRLLVYRSVISALRDPLMMRPHGPILRRLPCATDLPPGALHPADGLLGGRVMDAAWVPRSSGILRSVRTSALVNPCLDAYKSSHYHLAVHFLSRRAIGEDWARFYASRAASLSAVSLLRVPFKWRLPDINNTVAMATRCPCCHGNASGHGILVACCCCPRRPMRHDGCSAWQPSIPSV